MFDENDEYDLGSLEQELPEENAVPDVVIEDVSNTPEQTAEAKEEDDKESYSRRVQKRIDKLAYERNVERELRLKDSAELAALKAQTEEFRQEIEELKQFRQKEAEQQTNLELEQKRQELIKRKKEALEIGDYDEVALVDDDLMDIKLQLRQKPEPVKQTQPEPVKPAPKEPEPVQEPVVNIPKALQDWEANNPWVYDPKQAARLEKTNKIYQALLEDGYEADDPDTFIQLDKRLKRETPPAVSGVDRGEVVGTTAQTGFSAQDKTLMREFGLDPDNPVHRKEWIKNRK